MRQWPQIIVVHPVNMLEIYVGQVLWPDVSDDAIIINIIVYFTFYNSTSDFQN